MLGLACQWLQWYITEDEAFTCSHPLSYLQLHTPQSSQKSFPALVLTIKEMLLVVNLSRKVASSGNFTGFCVRFANQFTLRQRTWTMDPKKNKMINSGECLVNCTVICDSIPLPSFAVGIVNQGTFRLCVATKKRRSETDHSGSM